MPETSIIIRTYNEEKHLGNLLRSINNQDYKNYEIIIVDSGSTDKTLEIAEQFSVSVIKIESWDFTFGYALNLGIKASQGKYLVFASAHVLPVDNQWLGNLIAPFKNEKIAIVYGQQIGDDNSKFSEKRDFTKLFGTLPIDSVEAINHVNNANAAIRKELWEERQYDRYLFGLEDIEWAKYITGRGYLVHYEPKAAIYHLHNEKWHQVFNRYRREAIAAYRLGLKRPPQAKISLLSLPLNIIIDLIYSFPDFKLERIEEILKFRYYQWRGSRQGWFKDKNLDFDREKYNLFYPTVSQAVIIKDKNQAEFEEVVLPEIKPGDILIQVNYVGLCRTDIEVYEGTLGYYKDGLAHYPIIPGHEYAGIIVRIGANNKYRERFKVGQPVIGECVLSRENNDNRKEVGVINHNGAYSQFMILPGKFVHKVPEGLSLKVAALAEPLAVVLRALRRIRSRLFDGATIAVIGAGTIGNFCAQVLSLEGYSVTVFDKREERLNFLKSKVTKAMDTIAGLDQFDFIIEATGSKLALEEVLRDSRINSTILLLGFPYGKIDYNFEDLIGREKVIVGSVGGDAEDFARALEILPKLDTEPFTQKILPLKDFKQAWRLQEESKYLKILLKP